MDRARIRARLIELIIQVCDLEDMGVTTIDEDEQLVGGRLDLNSLDSIEIAAAIDYEFEVRIQDLSVAKEAFRTVRTLADHIADKRGWPA